MIGIGAIFMDAFMLAIGLFLFLGSLAALIRERRSIRRGVYNKRNFEGTSLFGFGLSAMFLAALCSLYVREIHLHSDLSHLRPEKVDRIAIGGQVINDRQRIDEIVRILARPRWFNMSRGDAGDKVSFMIRFKDGTNWEYVANSYQRGVGVTLESVSPHGWANGQVLYPELTGILQRDGITLPPCKTIQGKPMYCAPWNTAVSAKR
jgi:hypothetical protein